MTSSLDVLAFVLSGVWFDRSPVRLDIDDSGRLPLECVPDLAGLALGATVEVLAEDVRLVEVEVCLRSLF